jgi:putative PIN family toxin of toxin-antitoxin system
MARAKPRPFLDTNVIFSGLYSPSGPPAEILDRHAQGRLTIVVSRQVLDEIVVVIERKKPEILPLLRVFLLNAPPEFAPDPTPEEVGRVRHYIHEADAPILAAALKSRADCIVTGNTRHFTPNVATRAGIPIYTPSVYLVHLETEQAEST